MEGGDVIEEPADEVIPPTFDLQLGGGFINRSLAYRDDNSMPVRLRPYSLPAGPAVVAHVIWFPLGPFTDGPMKNLGIEGHIEQGFFISSTLARTDPGLFPNGAKFSTAIHEYSGGARYRMTFGAGNYFFGSLTGGEHAFTFHSTSTAADMQRGNLDIPDTIYRYLRPGVGLHVEVGGGFSLGIAAGFRWVFNKGGQFHDAFFKRSSVNGVDAQAKVGYRITPMFEARAIVDWRRYFSSMNCFNGLDPGGNAINGCDTGIHRGRRHRPVLQRQPGDRHDDGRDGDHGRGGRGAAPAAEAQAQGRAKTRSRRGRRRRGRQRVARPARSFTWIWTRSTRPSSSATTRPCAGGP